MQRELHLLRQEQNNQKSHRLLPDVKLNDIQKTKAGTFTLYAKDTKSLNELLTKFVPAQIQHYPSTNENIYSTRHPKNVGYTDKEAFVTGVDVEISPQDIEEVLKDEYHVEKVERLRNKQKNEHTAYEVFNISYPLSTKFTLQTMNGIVFKTRDFNLSLGAQRFLDTFSFLFSMTNDAVALSSNVIQHDLSSSRSKTVGRILLGIFGGVGVGLTVLALPFVTPALRKHALPYVPATKEQITNIFHLLKNRNRQIQSLVDLGSGDGRIVSVFESIKQGFKQSTGIELNRVLLYYSRIYALINGGRYPLSSWNFKRANIWKHDLSKYENIVIFGVDSMDN
ncbi:unnamed protein product [Didymodactylos carnosus]|uniref:Uncharacterized protein n=1 Tax=Didymodactylos carnosus TaxID=1234261 RepID=A0A814BWD7_9BILA|nr:unnamed protein product [Didymodactylos carnosus]CAF3712413.1 unnamed protein product [Didymodactylos carnosus]